MELDLLSRELDLPVSAVLGLEAVSGGDISQAFRLRTTGLDYFVKVNSAAMRPMFIAEAAALKKISESDAVRVPEPVRCGEGGGESWLILEWLDLQRGDNECAREFGRSLARMHQVGADEHGWNGDNFIGSTPQRNTWTRSWASFYASERLAVQAELAARLPLTQRLARSLFALCDVVPQLLADHEPSPSLLHGDLWGGNWAALTDNTPVMFDPAAYYGDRETDLAMTELFGGFSSGFYDAYNDAWPLSASYPERRKLYQLYHIANHANLFGGSYVAQALAITERLLAKARGGSKLS